MYLAALKQLLHLLVAGGLHQFDAAFQGRAKTGDDRLVFAEGDGRIFDADLAFCSGISNTPPICSSPSLCSSLVDER